MAALKPRNQAPNFSLLDQDARPVKLEDFKGRKLLVYFYPRADPPGCTKQACSVRDSLKTLTARKVSVVGISPDRPDAQKKFDGKYTLQFPLLSDPDSKVAKAYGAWGEKSMYGKKYEGIIRSSFLLDEGGRLIQAWYKVSPGETVPKALEALGDGTI
jgi:thioredoxin-dependent peroxiredoxin